MIGPNGQLMSKTQDTTGQSFGGSSSSQPIPPITPDEVSAAANAANPSNVQTKPSIPPTSGIGMGDLSPLLRGDTNPNNVQTKPVLAPQQSDGLGVAPVPLGLQIQKLLQMLKPSPTNNGTNQFDPY
jgi:hypothetical protein